MLRNRSSAVTSKQTLMADQTSLLSPTKNFSTPISSLLASPRFFNGLLTKSFSDAETTLMSPTSILDTKNSSSFVNPFGNNKNFPKPQTPCPEIINSCHKSEPEAIGLALIDSLNEEKSDANFSKPINRMALLGSKLKVQIPAINPSYSIPPVQSPKSQTDFGIKTGNSQFSGISPEALAKDFTRQLSLKEMELSEDYTCVITHGPNPKTTHIFDDCIVEGCSGEDITVSDDKKIECDHETNVSTSSSVNFLSFCHTCKDNLEQGKDIFIYRGEKAFCSHECRCRGTVFEEMKNPEPENVL